METFKITPDSHVIMKCAECHYHNLIKFPNSSIYRQLALLYASCVALSGAEPLKTMATQIILDITLKFPSGGRRRTLQGSTNMLSLN